ncbi:MAG TPA: ABC transporter substrate-binding protein [Gammaproteobacteria bacterium]|nr:ABC transporter substrate-binding protein [Gammaproteobacteria bacterium]
MLQFPSKFGSMTFPNKFPAGTTLTITQWSHFVPRYDKWFDAYAQDWGKANNVKVTVNHINLGDLATSLSSAIAARKGSDLYEMIAPPAAFIQGLQPLNDINRAAAAAFGERSGVCTHSSYLPVKNEWYGFCHGWVPDPGDYLVSDWTKAGYPNGPSSYEDLLKGGEKIYKDTGIPVGVGMSPEIDSEFYARSLIWSFGGSIQNAHDQVTFDSPQVIKAVAYQAKLYKAAETPEVFTWNPASNNQTFIAGQTSYIQNSISFYRSAQEVNPKVAANTGFSPGLKGPTGDIRQTAHVYFIYVMPKYVNNLDSKSAAKKFMLDLESNYSQATYNSELYNFPAFASTAPQLTQKGGWLDHDPFGSEPANKLEVLRNAESWTGWLGYPGYANPAVSEVYEEHLISAMMAEVARGNKTPEEAVKQTTAQINAIFAKWRKLGYLQGGS